MFGFPVPSYSYQSGCVMLLCYCLLAPRPLPSSLRGHHHQREQKENLEKPQGQHLNKQMECFHGKLSETNKKWTIFVRGERYLDRRPKTAPGRQLKIISDPLWSTLFQWTHKNTSSSTLKENSEKTRMINQADYQRLHRLFRFKRHRIRWVVRFRVLVEETTESLSLIVILSSLVVNKVLLLGVSQNFRGRGSQLWLRI